MSYYDPGEPYSEPSKRAVVVTFLMCFTAAVGAVAYAIFG